MKTNLGRMLAAGLIVMTFMIVMTVTTGWMVPAEAQSAPRRSRKTALHVPHDRQVSFTTQLQDGGGKRWDIQTGLQKKTTLEELDLADVARTMEAGGFLA